MAMPASGCIGIITCPNSVACTSIAQAVDGNVTPPKSLATLSATAGKSAPHSMVEFYGYTPPPTTFDVNMRVIYYGSYDNFEGTAYLRCSNNVEYASCHIIGVSCYFTWADVPAGSYYVDMADVVGKLGGNSMPTSYEWYDAFGQGYTPYTSVFSGANDVYFDLYD